MNDKVLHIEDHAAVRVIRIHRPDKLNALNHATVAALREAVEAFAASATARVAVITGSGDKAFVAGADIGEIRALDARGAADFAAAGQALMRRIETLDKPVIAAINGYALGGGLELALACPLRIAAGNARLGLPEITLGIIPGFGGTQRLTRAIGPGRALEMMSSGRPIDAEKALDYGLIQRLENDRPVLDAALDWAAELASRAPLALGYILHATRAAGDLSLEAGLDLETRLFALACTTEDMREGTGAFLEKRQPHFTGR